MTEDFPNRPTTAGVLLFDMDGTLVDSGVVVERIWRDFAGRHGLDAQAILAASPGRRSSDVIAQFAPPGMDVAAETVQIVAREVEDDEGIVAVPGAARLLSTLPADRWALVTSAGVALATRRMRAAGLPLPTVLISADDVRRGKPDPEGYLAAAARLGRPAVEALAFEDTDAGLAAIRGAGARPVAVGPENTGRAQGLPWIADFRGVEVEQGADGRLEVRMGSGDGSGEGR